VNDVNRVQSLLHHGWGFGNIRTLKGAAATREAIFAELKLLATCTGVVVIYVSGHGARLTSKEGKTDEGILPSDIAFRRNTEKEWEAGTAEAITGLDLEPILAEMSSNAAITLLFDTCHSGCLYRHGQLPSTATRVKTPMLKDGFLVFKCGQLGTGWLPESSSGHFVHLAASSHLHSALELDENVTHRRSAGAFTLALEQVIAKLRAGEYQSGISQFTPFPLSVV